MKSNQTPDKLFNDLFTELLKKNPQIEDKIISIAESGFDIRDFEIYFVESKFNKNQRNTIKDNFRKLVLKNYIQIVKDYSALAEIKFDGDLKKQKLEMLKVLSELRIPLSILKTLNDPLSILLENISRLFQDQLSIISKYEEENKPYEEVNPLNWLGTKTDLAYLLKWLFDNKYFKENFTDICKHFLFEERPVTANSLHIIHKKISDGDKSYKPKIEISLKP